MFIIVLGQHVLILMDSSSGPSKIQTLTLQCYIIKDEAQTSLFKDPVRTAL